MCTIFTEAVKSQTMSCFLGRGAGGGVLSYLKDPAQIGKTSTTSSQVRPLLLATHNLKLSPLGKQY